MINRVKQRCAVFFFLFFFKKLPVCHRNVSFFSVKISIYVTHYQVFQDWN